MGCTYSTANEYKRYLWNSVRFPIIVFAAAAFCTGLPLQLGNFAISVCFVAMAVLPLAGLHVGETLSKAIINMVAYILGALLGYGLRRFSEHEIGIVVVLVVIFILIALGIFGRSVIKKVKDGYDYAPMAFLLAMFLALVYPFGPDWLTKEFDRNTKTLAIAYTLTILSTYIPPFFAGDELHYRVQKNIYDLADIFKDLNEKCFGGSLQYLQDKLFLEKLQSLINSKEKENSLSKFRSWELRWHPHPQEQYEKIGDFIRLCAFPILSLSTTVENLHFNTHLRETCKEICSESAKALAQLSHSMKNKTVPAPSINNHLDRASRLIKNYKLELTAALKLTLHPDNTLELTTALNLVSHPDNMPELTTALNLASHPDNMQELNAALKLTSYLEDMRHPTAHLVKSVEFIKMLASSIKELSDLVPFKQCEQDSNVPELVTGLESPIGNSETQREEDKLGQVAIDIDPPAGPV